MDVHSVLRCVITQQVMLQRVPCYGCAFCASLCDHAAGYVAKSALLWMCILCFAV